MCNQTVLKWLLQADPEKLSFSWLCRYHNIIEAHRWIEGSYRQSCGATSAQPRIYCFQPYNWGEHRPTGLLNTTSAMFAWVAIHHPGQLEAFRFAQRRWRQMFMYAVSVDEAATYRMRYEIAAYQDQDRQTTIGTKVMGINHVDVVPSWDFPSNRPVNHMVGTNPITGERCSLTLVAQKGGKPSPEVALKDCMKVVDELQAVPRSERKVGLYPTTNDAVEVLEDGTIVFDGFRLQEDP